MLCENCGKEIANNDKFCPYCGMQTRSTEGISVRKSKTQGSNVIVIVVIKVLLLIVVCGCAWAYLKRDRANVSNQYVNEQSFADGTSSDCNYYERNKETPEYTEFNDKANSVNSNKNEYAYNMECIRIADGERGFYLLLNDDLSAFDIMTNPRFAYENMNYPNIPVRSVIAIENGNILWQKNYDRENRILTFSEYVNLDGETEVYEDEYRYNSEGRLISVRYGERSIAEWQYDNYGRVIERSYERREDARTTYEKVSFEYDEESRIIHNKDDDYTSFYEYSDYKLCINSYFTSGITSVHECLLDENKKLVKTEYAVEYDNIKRNHTVEFLYDENCRIKKIIDCTLEDEKETDSLNTTYHYNEQGMITGWDITGNVSATVELELMDNGLIKKMITNNGNGEQIITEFYYYQN